jgi:hypothetical protein
MTFLVMVFRQISATAIAEPGSKAPIRLSKFIFAENARRFAKHGGEDSKKAKDCQVKA